MELSTVNWSQVYENTKRKLQATRKSGGAFSPGETKSILQAIENLEKQLDLMAASSMQYDLSPSELARRRVLIDNLKSQYTTSRPKSNITSPYSNGSSNDVSNKNNDSANLVQRQKDMIKLQDEMLEDMSKGLDRIHGQALAINDETKVHVRLLDDLDTNVDLAANALQAEAKHAERIKDTANVCWMYICIVVEVIVMIILLIVIFHT